MKNLAIIFLLCSFAYAGTSLEVPLEMVDYGVSSSTGAGGIIFKRTYITLDTDDYDGATYYFEIGVYNGNASNAYTVTLYDVTGSAAVATISVPKSTAYAVLRSAAWIPADATTRTYAIQTPQTAASNNIRVYNGRIVVNQVNATKTRIQIPLTQRGHGGYSNGDDTSTGAVDSIPASTYGQTVPAYYSKWLQDLSKYGTISGWTLEAVMNVTVSNNNVFAILWNMTDNCQVDDSEVTLAGSTIASLGSTDFDGTDPNFDDGDVYELYAKETSSGLGYVYRAALYVELTDLTTAELVWRVGNYLAASKVAQGFTACRLIIDTSDYSDFDVYFEATAACADNNDLISLFEYNGMVVTRVSNSSINVNSAAKTRVRTNAITITDDDQFWEYKSTSTNNATPTSAWVVMQTTGPMAAFSGTPLSGNNPLEVTFTDASTGSGLSWSWDFDGDSVEDSTDQNPVYEYANEGDWTVILTVTDSAGAVDTETKTAYINTSQGAEPPTTVSGSADILPLLIGENW